MGYAVRFHLLSDAREKCKENYSMPLTDTHPCRETG